LRQIEVTRDYRLVIDRPSTAACYLQGVNEATHGIADSLLSVLAQRANEILQDILSHRAAHPGANGDARIDAEAQVGAPAVAAV
jgi:L-ornithine N5-monooxygenase